MSARARSEIVLRIAASSDRAASWALRRASASRLLSSRSPSATSFSAARACSTASAYSPRWNAASAVSRWATAFSTSSPASLPSWILRSARPIRFLDAATSSFISAIAGRLLDFLPRPFQSPLRLVVQSDLDAFHDPIRRGDQVFRLLEGSSVDRLLGGRERLERVREIHVLRKEVLDLGPHRLHPPVDLLRALLFRPRDVRIRFSFRVRRCVRELFDLGDARLARIDRVAVASLGVRGLRILQHLGRGVDLDAVGLRPSDLAASLAEDLRRGASHELARRED